MMNEHIPVLLNEVLDGLNIKSDGIYLDLTLGRAGHSSEILKRIPHGYLIGIDQDDEAIIKSDIRLKNIASNYKIIKNNFSNIKSILNEEGIEYIDGALMDLGVSSPQFDESDRGFSYRNDAPLDMRMDKDNPLTAKKIVNTYSYQELVRIFKEYGDEKYASSVAHNIIKEREKQEIETTYQLVDIIKASKPQKELKKVGHPAKQIFQALRIEVNDELNVLRKALNDLTPFLRRGGGRLAVITFHSGEDKIVKKIFQELSISEGNRLDLPLNIEEKEFKEVNHKVIVPSLEEQENNPRSKSAKLRILERK